MSKPAPPPLKRFDLVESFNALALAGKEPDVQKKHSHLPCASSACPECTFIGGFDPRLLALGTTHRPSPSPTPARKSLPAIPPGKWQSLTAQCARKFQIPRTPTKPPIPPIVPLQPDLNSTLSPKVESNPPEESISLKTRPKEAVLDVTQSRTRSVSAPFVLTTSGGSARCNGMTQAGKPCLRQVKLPATHSSLDPMPALYCYHHKKVVLAPTGFYVQKTGIEERYVTFSDYIPGYLQKDTQLALRVEMEKATSSVDVPGYIYAFEIRDPKQTDVIQLKVGRTVNLIKRLDQWDKQCGSKEHILRGWWPAMAEDDETTGCSLRCNIKAGGPGPFCHRVERLVHIELADLSLHAPYLKPGWPDTTSGATASPRKDTTKQTKCPDCNKIHMEIFSFPRPDKGRYKGREWNLIVKPVIERWGSLIRVCVYDYSRY